MSKVYDFPINSLEGKAASLADFKGKKMLLVNVASACGFTPQYNELQALHEKHGDKVAVLGFPSNDFGAQEPGTAEQIRDFCTTHFGVSFPMFEKIKVKGADAHPLYQYLSDASANGKVGQSPNWNFCKYLVNEDGEVEAFYASSVSPMGPEILKAVGA